MKKFMNYLRVAVVALTISMAMSGCSSSDDPAPAPSYNVSLVNESDAALDVDPAALSEQIIKIQTDAPLTDLSIQKVTEQSWCIATVKNTSEIAARRLISTRVLSHTGGRQPPERDPHHRVRAVAGV